MTHKDRGVLEAFQGTAADVTDDFVLDKCDYFTGTQLWPLHREVNPRLWLQNFRDHEKRHARYLLNGFIYLSSHIVEQIAIDAFEALSRAIVLPHNDDYAASARRWSEFVQNVRIVVVRGETPSPTDSGYQFARIARDRIGIPEHRVLDVAEALRMLQRGGKEPLVFLDDFVGSGDQFIETWTTPRSIDGDFLSFELFANRHSGSYYYCPVIATSYGMSRIKTSCPAVSLQPGHELSHRYNVFHPESLIWPEDLRGSSEDFIHQVSLRAGIPDTDGGENDWRGFHKLGLALAFSHGAPDATLPLFWWESETWNPLKKRPQS